MSGSGFPQAFLFSLWPAALTLVLKLTNAYEDGDILYDSTAWGGFSFLVGFLVVFRTSQAYSRFWDGCSSTYLLRAEWIDAASALIAFCKHSKAPPEKVSEFKHLVVRLFSLLHMFALGYIEDCEDMDDITAFDLELIDPNGIDPESWKAMIECKNRVGLVFQWIQCTIVEAISTGVMSIPPPILSRVFQELANGMVALHDAHKISSIPFPFPYAQTCDALLLLHSCITPFIVAEKVNDPAWAVSLAFITVFILWSLNYIAVEIENPFGNDANDLNAGEMQLDMNMNLLLLLHPASQRTPTLSQHAVKDGLVRMGRGASQVVGDNRTFNQMFHRDSDYENIDERDSSTPCFPSELVDSSASRSLAKKKNSLDEQELRDAHAGQRQRRRAPSDFVSGSTLRTSKSTDSVMIQQTGSPIMSTGTMRSTQLSTPNPAPRRSVASMMSHLPGPRRMSVHTSKLANPEYGQGFWDMCERDIYQESDMDKSCESHSNSSIPKMMAPPAVQASVVTPGTEIIPTVAHKQGIMEIRSWSEEPGGSNPPPMEASSEVRLRNEGDRDPEPQATSTVFTPGRGQATRMAAARSSPRLPQLQSPREERNLPPMPVDSRASSRTSSKRAAEVVDQLPQRSV
jgi:predicted membrane chloride channel (bestrophin family)